MKLVEGYIYTCSHCHSQGKNVAHSLKDCRKTKKNKKKRIGHCTDAVPNREKNSHNRTYVSRIITNACKDNIGSKKWKSDRPKLNNKLYAWVLKQNSCQPSVSERNKSVNNSKSHLKNQP